MRRSTLGWVLTTAVLLPTVGTAQVLVLPNSYPHVTAASAPWLLRGDPIFHAGSFYYPTGPTVFFDGNVMMRTDIFQGVAIYEDATQVPFSVVYVPIGGNVVRPYERRREGELAGTVGSRTPSFPIQQAGEAPAAGAPLGTTGSLTPPVDHVIPEGVRPIGTTGVITTAIPPAAPTRPVRRANTPRILQVWVPFDGARWYSAGSALSYSPDRFVQVGSYKGFPVYRDRNGSREEIYIPSVTGGPVAPYKKK
jgi:hypothetical protein